MVWLEEWGRGAERARRHRARGHLPAGARRGWRSTGRQARALRAAQLPGGRTWVHAAAPGAPAPKGVGREEGGTALKALCLLAGPLLPRGVAARRAGGGSGAGAASVVIARIACGSQRCTARPNTVPKGLQPLAGPLQTGPLPAARTPQGRSREESAARLLSASQMSLGWLSSLRSEVMADSTRAAFCVANSAAAALDSKKWQYRARCSGVSRQHTISTTCGTGWR